MGPHPSIVVISFNWNRLGSITFLPTCLSKSLCKFTIRSYITLFFTKVILLALYLNLLASFGVPSACVSYPQMLSFNRISIEPLGILPRLPIILGGKIFYINVMVVQGPLEFNLLLGWYYVYAMKAFISTLFQVMHFHHNGNIVTIDQISFISPDMTIDHLNSLNVPYMKVISILPQVN